MIQQILPCMMVRTIASTSFGCKPFITSHKSKRCKTTCALNNQQIKDYILQNTEISNEHLTPEIPLRLITHNCRLWLAREEDVMVPDPFWAFYWPGGQALTRYILDHPRVVQNKCVLDVGSGCGASAIAAFMRGAKRVIANDICQVAVEAIQLNARLNKVRGLEVTTCNLIGTNKGGWDVVLLGDMFYDEGFTNKIDDWLNALRANQTRVLIGDPGRMHFSNHPMKKQLCEVGRYELPPQSKEENNGLTHGHVWEFT